MENGKLLFDFFLSNLDAKLLLYSNLNVHNVSLLKINDPFTKELIEAWSYLNFKKTTI